MKLSMSFSIAVESPGKKNTDMLYNNIISKKTVLTSIIAYYSHNTSYAMLCNINKSKYLNIPLYGYVHVNLILILTKP